MPLRVVHALVPAVAVVVLACSADPPQQDPQSGAGGGGEGGAGGAGGIVEPAADPLSFRATAPLAGARRAHTATVLLDGRVLVVGGELGADSDKVDTAEIFDPVTETWTPLPALPEPRSNHTATLLDDGRVLIAGGGDNAIIGIPSGEEATATALLFDAATGTFTPTGSMLEPRAAHRAERLADGRVLVVGGGTDMVFGPCGPTPNCNVAVSLASAELYDPASEEWSTTGAMAESRLNFTLTMLGDGTVLAAGGFSSDVDDTIATAERYDPNLATWASAGVLSTGDRLHHAAAALGSGGALLAGGKKANVAPLDTVERFDLASSAWSQVASLDAPRTGAAMLTLQSGHVLHAGGFNQFTGDVLANCAIFAEETGSWTAIAPLLVPRIFHSAVLLLDGRVLVCGGSPGFGVTDQCDLSQN